MVVLEKSIEGRKCQLVLLDDTITIEVVVDGEVIESEKAWEAMRNDDWLQDSYLKMVVSSYLKSKDGEFGRLAKRLFKL